MAQKKKKIHADSRKSFWDIQQNETDIPIMEIVSPHLENSLGVWCLICPKPFYSKVMRGEKIFSRVSKRLSKATPAHSRNKRDLRKRENKGKRMVSVISMEKLSRGITIVNNPIALFS